MDQSSFWLFSRGCWCCSIAQSHPTVYNPLDCSTPGFPVFHTIFQSLFKLMSIESVMPANHLILCRPPLLLPSVFPSIRVSRGNCFEIQEQVKVFEVVVCGVTITEIVPSLIQRRPAARSLDRSLQGFLPGSSEEVCPARLLETRGRVRMGGWVFGA